MQHTRRSGRRSVTSRAIMSISPRTALTGVPSGAFTDSGTPKKARKYSEGVSSSISPGTLVMVPRHGSLDQDGHQARVVVGVRGAERLQDQVQHGLRVRGGPGGDLQ